MTYETRIDAKPMGDDKSLIDDPQRFLSAIVAAKPVTCEIARNDHTWCLTHNCRVTDAAHPRDFDGYVGTRLYVEVKGNVLPNSPSDGNV